MIAVAVGVAACSGGGGGGTSNPPEIGAGSALAGPFNGATTSGAIEVNVAASFAPASFVPINITGTMTLSNGSSLNMTGTIDPDTKAITLAGSNASGSFSFVGSSEGGRVTGTWTGPADAGTFSLINATGASAQLYCGTFTIPGDTTGSLDLVITDDFVAGLASPDDGGSDAYLEGNRSGDTVEVEIYTGEGLQARATGTVSGTVVSGTIVGPNGEQPPGGTATFQAAACP